MDALSIYKEFASLKMTDKEADEFVKGYRVYSALTAKDWLQTPCRLVYRKPDSVSMVVLPFFIPELKDLIWGIEVEGTYLCINAQPYTELYSGSVVAKLWGDCSVFWGNFTMAQERPFELPETAEFHRWHQLCETVNLTFVMLRKAGLTVHSLQERDFVKTPPETPQKVVGYRSFKTESATEANLRYVLHADNKRDIFCSVSRFGVPNRNALKKCLKSLGYTLPKQVYDLL